MPELNLPKALGHVQERRSPADAWYVILRFQYQVLPRSHSGRSALTFPIVRAGLENDPLLQKKRLAHTFPYTMDGTCPMSRSPVSWEPENSSGFESAPSQRVFNVVQQVNVHLFAVFQDARHESRQLRCPSWL